MSIIIEHLILQLAKFSIMIMCHLMPNPCNETYEYDLCCDAQWCDGLFTPYLQLHQLITAIYTLFGNIPVNGCVGVRIVVISD